MQEELGPAAAPRGQAGELEQPVHHRGDGHGHQFILEVEPGQQDDQGGLGAEALDQLGDGAAVIAERSPAVERVDMRRSMREVARQCCLARGKPGWGRTARGPRPSPLHLHNEVKRQEQPHFPPGEARMCSVHLQQPG